MIAAAPVRDSLAALRTLVSPYTGLVSSTTEILRAPDDARLFRVGCSLADTRAAIGFSTDFRAGGSAPDADGAMAAALGEVAERYSASFVPDDLPLAAARDLGPEAVAPERFALFHARQYDTPAFAFQRFTDETPVRWTRGFALPGGEPAWLPAQLVYLPWHLTAPGEVRIGYSTSNGAACGPTLADAVLSGLLELVERDAFALTWLGRHSLPVLDVASDAAASAYDARHFGAAGVVPVAVDLSAFMDVPVVLALLRASDTGEPALCVGAAAASTAVEAWKRAVAEAFAVRVWARAMLARRSVATPGCFEEVVSFDDHILFWASAVNAEHSAFLDASAERRPIADVPPLEGASARERAAELCDRLARRGASAYAVDVTAPDVRDAGLAVAKVVVPELVPLDAAYDARFLGGARLRTAAAEAGLRDAPLDLEDVNPFPHPFP